MELPEIPPLEGYTKDEMIEGLSKLRKHYKKPPVPSATFYRWLKQLNIEPKFRYNDEDLLRLTKICTHYSQGGKSSNLPEI